MFPTMGNDDPEGEMQHFKMEKSDVSSSQLATAFWADVLRSTSKRMDKMDADTYEVEVEVTIRDDS